MIETGKHSTEATEIWTSLLALHRQMKLGAEITHPMRQQLVAITKRQFAHADALSKVTSYTKE